VRRSSGFVDRRKHEFAVLPPRSREMRAHHTHTRKLQQ